MEGIAARTHHVHMLVTPQRHRDVKFDFAPGAVVMTEVRVEIKAVSSNLCRIAIHKHLQGFAAGKSPRLRTGEGPGYQRSSTVTSRIPHASRAFAISCPVNLRILQCPAAHRNVTKYNVPRSEIKFLMMPMWKCGERQQSHCVGSSGSSSTEGDHHWHSETCLWKQNIFFFSESVGGGWCRPCAVDRVCAIFDTAAAALLRFELEAMKGGDTALPVDEISLQILSLRSFTVMPTGIGLSSMTTFKGEVVAMSL